MFYWFGEFTINFIAQKNFSILLQQVFKVCLYFLKDYQKPADKFIQKKLSTFARL